MKDVKIPPYLPPELEIVTYKESDILTASTDLEADDNVDYEW